MINDNSEFETWFQEFNTWNANWDELIRASFTPGDDPGDEVLVSESGSVMTRFMCHYWLNFYSAAKTGWEARDEAR